METDFNLLASSHVTKLEIFRGYYLGVMEHLSRERLGKVNSAELAVLLTRGGRRIPTWMRSMSTKEVNLDFPLQELTEQQLHRYFAELQATLLLHRVVPKTKITLFATYLAGHVCANGESLTRFAGIAKSTAHKWLSRCTEFGLLEIFQTEHEIYYVHPALMQLVMVGSTEQKHLYRHEFMLDLAELRRRSRFWLQRSRLVERMEKDLRTY